MSVKSKFEPQQPHVLRAHRLMEAFAKSDDERDFYLDRIEGFIIYVDLDKPQNEIEELEKELTKNSERYCMIPKLTFYETKKIMEGFVNEKVYDIDTKEKLLDIIQSKEARTNFLEFIYDHLTELEKWQQYYQERSRIRIIEWLRQNHFNFVFEEDLEFVRSLLEKLKQSIFQNKVGKEILSARKILLAKAKTYYSNEALNPRPKRGRPPKQAVKLEIEPQLSSDIYQTASPATRPFLFTPDISSAAAVTFSASFDNPEMVANRRQPATYSESSLESIQQKLAALRGLSTRTPKNGEKVRSVNSFEDDEEDLGDIEDEDFDGEEFEAKPKIAGKGSVGKAKRKPKTSIKSLSKTQSETLPKEKPKAAAKSKPKAALPTKKVQLRPVIKSNNKTTLATASGKKKHKRIIPIQKPVTKAKAVITKAHPKAKMKSSSNGTVKTPSKGAKPDTKSPAKPVSRDTSSSSTKTKPIVKAPMRKR